MTRTSFHWLMNLLGNPSKKQQKKIAASKTNSGPKKSNKISGKWKITGSVMRPWDLATPDRSFKFLPFNSNFIIKQDETSNYCMVYIEQDITDKNELKPEVGYQPAVLTDIFSNKLELTVADYDDNGTYRFAETQRDINGEVSEFQGIYVEAGHVGTLLQVPTSGSFTLKKITTDDTINEPPRVSEKQKHIRIVSGAGDGPLYYNVGEMFAEYLTPLGLKYTIRYTGALYNKNDQIVGKIVATNDYVIDNGVSTCTFLNDYIIFKKADTSLDYVPTDRPYKLPKDMEFIGRYATKGTFNAFTQRETQYVGSTDETVILVVGFEDFIIGKTEEFKRSRNNNNRLGGIGAVVDQITAPFDELATFIIDLVTGAPPTNQSQQNSNGGINTSPYESINRVLKERLRKEGYEEGKDYEFPPSPGQLFENAILGR